MKIGGGKPISQKSPAHDISVVSLVISNFSRALRVLMLVKTAQPQPTSPIKKTQRPYVLTKQWTLTNQDIANKLEKNYDSSSNSLISCPAVLKITGKFNFQSKFKATYAINTLYLHQTK